jgi:hypothetical protein
MKKKRTPRKKAVELRVKDATKVVGGQARPSETLGINYGKIQY